MGFGVSMVPPYRIAKAYVAGLVVLAVALSLALLDYAAQPHVLGFVGWAGVVFAGVVVAIAVVGVLPRLTHRGRSLR